jgi:general secretion pathway protein E
LSSIAIPHIDEFDKKVLGALISTHQLEEAQLEFVQNMTSELDIDAITALVRLGLVGDDTLYECFSNLLHWPLIDKVSLCPKATAIISSCDTLKLSIDWCLANHVFPIFNDDTLKIYTDAPKAKDNWQAVILASHNAKVDAFLLTPAMASSIEDEISRERAVASLFGEHTTDVAALAEEAPIINLVNSIVERAVQAEASDIHVETNSRNMVIRFRVDGKLTEFMQQPTSRFAAIASRIKLLSNLDIAERRLPQDGRFTARAGKKQYDVRVSTAPDVHGESIVMRLLPKNRDSLGLDALGFLDDHLQLIKEWSKLNNGIILVTGPTGSGKSTTLYGLLSDMKTGEEKILTVEDPVEYQLDGITQVQARSDIGYTFAKALRTFLRQDPDIIMVGEIRDKETADIAIQSSLTGHLVLSTLHTNDASSVFTRLADIGVEPYLTAATIQGVQAQRLVRKLCVECSEPIEQPAFIADLMQSCEQTVSTNWRRPVGCKACQGRGYRGRIGIYELVPVTSELRALVAANASVSKLRDVARSAGFRSLLQDGLLKASQGISSAEEVLRVCANNEGE